MGAKQPLYPHQPRKKHVQYPHRQPGRAPSTGGSQYAGGWKPGDLAIYSDFGLRSLFIVRVLEWPEDKGDRFTEHFGGGGVFGSITHDRAGGETVRAEIIDTSLVDWDFPWEPRISEHRQEGTIHYYNHSNLYRNIDEIIENERRILYPEVLVKILYDLRKHPGWIMLAVYGLRKSVTRMAKAVPQLFPQEEELERKYPGITVQFYGEEGVRIHGEAIDTKTGKDLANVEATTMNKAKELLDKEMAKIRAPHIPNRQPGTVSEETGWTKMQDILDALEKLTKYEIGEVSRKLYNDLDDFIVFQSGATKKDMVSSLVRWFKRVSHKDRITFIKAVQAKLAEKEQLPVRGEVPGTRYIKWADFTSLPNYPLISRAVNHPHDHRRACKPYTKDGYLSVDAIYNMSSWAGWKSSSLGDRERAIANAIHDLPLGELMTLNSGRRMDQPALLPEGLLPTTRSVPCR